VVVDGDRDLGRVVGLADAAAVGSDVCNGRLLMFGGLVDSLGH
jgi:hypothetical protein